MRGEREERDFFAFSVLSYPSEKCANVGSTGAKQKAETSDKVLFFLFSGEDCPS